MPVYLLIAPPASGKTEYCLQEINEVKSTNPLANIRVQVMDRMKAAFIHQQLAESGSCISVNVGTIAIYTSKS